MREHFRIRSIPPRTTLDAVREQERGTGRIGFGAGSLGNSEPNPGEFDIKRHIFKKPTGEKSINPLVIPENQRIMWQVEIIEDYNNAGDLGLIVQFSGISFMSTFVFERSRHNYGSDSRVFYAPVEYKNGQAFLILSTLGDIFESQVVSRMKDVHPFFREEIYYPPLLTFYDPTSMRISYNNGLIIVSYNDCYPAGGIT